MQEQVRDTTSEEDNDDIAPNAANDDDDDDADAASSNKPSVDDDVARTERLLKIVLQFTSKNRNNLHSWGGIYIGHSKT